jgi:hypothetical protein
MGGRFCSPLGRLFANNIWPQDPPQTSSDTKRFARTVREADSSTGWREDEQLGVLVAPFGLPKMSEGNKAVRRTSIEYADIKTATQILARTGR